MEKFFANYCKKGIDKHSILCYTVITNKETKLETLGGQYND